jgi:hypothetical protein
MKCVVVGVPVFVFVGVRLCKRVSGCVVSVRVPVGAVARGVVVRVVSGWCCSGWSCRTGALAEV